MSDDLGIRDTIERLVSVLRTPSRHGAYAHERALRDVTERIAALDSRFGPEVDHAYARGWRDATHYLRHGVLPEPVGRTPDTAPDTPEEPRNRT